MLRYICPSLAQKGVFERFKGYYTWSRWDKLLFLSPVTDLDHFFTSDGEDGYLLSSNLQNIKHTKEEPFANFYPEKNDICLKVVWDVLTLRESVKPVWDLGLYRSVILRLFCGMLEYIMYTIHIIFLVFICYASWEVGKPLWTGEQSNFLLFTYFEKISKTQGICPSQFNSTN
mmetsp:Transcript_11715/g.25732  ORF Transcript_11715/g.25732 Transcript_11715/m.25732 type:complete len:173 (+) Transcript_11715:508-1026(+)